DDVLLQDDEIADRQTEADRERQGTGRGPVGKRQADADSPRASCAGRAPSGAAGGGAATERLFFGQAAILFREAGCERHRISETRVGGAAGNSIWRDAQLRGHCEADSAAGGGSRRGGGEREKSRVNYCAVPSRDRFDREADWVCRRA